MTRYSKLVSLLLLAILPAATSAQQSDGSAFAECRLDHSKAKAELAKLREIGRIASNFGEKSITTTYDPRYFRPFGIRSEGVKVVATQFPEGIYIEILTTLSGGFDAAQSALLRGHGFTKCAKSYSDGSLRACEFVGVDPEIVVKLAQARDGAIISQGVRQWGNIELSCTY